MTRRIPALLLVFAVTACSGVQRLDLGKSTSALAFRDRVDWTAAGDEAVGVLAGYLQTDTSNPPGNETRGAQYLAGVLAREGIASEIVEFAPGRGTLLARLPGDGTQRPLCLVSHIDVVPADGPKWPKDTQPFAGVVKDGVLWGRGALDMKGLGALEVMTLVWLHRLHVPLNRDVVLLAVADEEVASGGMRQAVEQLWPKIGCSHAVNEGGLGLRDMMFPGQTFFAVSVVEKGILWLKMTAHGPAGHGSTPLPGRAPERLLKAIAKLQAREQTPVMHASLRQSLAEAGHQHGGIAGYVLRHPGLHGMLVTGKLMDNPASRAALTNTVNVTGMQGGSEPNVVPSEVSATLDCRLLPGVKPAAFLASLRRIVDDPEVTFDVLYEAEASESPIDDPWFRALARHAIEGRPHAAVGPVLSVGFTDSLFLRPKGVHAYGLVPFEISQEEAATMHGANERVSTENVRRGLRVLLGAVLDVSSQAAGQNGQALSLPGQAR
jgi:acetylornithine deacetylase/succinyl-diaminopimelate desuccinylase-like protein